MNTTDGVRNQSPIGLLLRRLDGLINDRFERTLGTRGITRRQWQLLHTLAERPATLDDLNATVAPFLDRAARESVQQHLAPLVAKGVVTAAGDGYELTDVGRTLFGSLREDVRVTRELTVRGLTEGDYERTIASLQTMVDNLNEDA